MEERGRERESKGLLKRRGFDPVTSDLVNPEVIG